jgi:hypothetical protein
MLKDTGTGEPLVIRISWILTSFMLRDTGTGEPLVIRISWILTVVLW